MITAAEVRRFITELKGKSRARMRRADLARVVGDVATHREPARGGVRALDLRAQYVTGEKP